MTATLLRLDDCRPPPMGMGSLYLQALFHLWLGCVLLAMLPAILARGKR